MSKIPDDLRYIGEDIAAQFSRGRVCDMLSIKIQEALLTERVRGINDAIKHFPDEIVGAALNVVHQTDRMLDNDPWPIKYRAPYEAITKLRLALYKHKANKTKPLEWKHVEKKGTWVADTYVINLCAGYFVVKGWKAPVGTNPYETLEMAQAAAQRDHDAYVCKGDNNAGG
jgi:hypothetical protein